MDARNLIQAAGKALITGANSYLEAQIYLKQAKTAKQKSEAEMMIKNRAYELQKRQADISELKLFLDAQEAKQKRGDTRTDYEQRLATYNKIMEIEDENERNRQGRIAFPDDWDKLTGTNPDALDTHERKRRVRTRLKQEVDEIDKEISELNIKIGKAETPEAEAELQKQVNEKKTERQNKLNDMDRIDLGLEPSYLDESDDTTTTKHPKYADMSTEFLEQYVNTVDKANLERWANNLPDEAARKEALSNIPEMLSLIISQRRRPTSQELVKYGFVPEAFDDDDSNIPPEQLAAIDEISAQLTPEQSAIFRPLAIARVRDGDAIPSPAGIMSALAKPDPSVVELLEPIMKDLPDNQFGNMIRGGILSLSKHQKTPKEKQDTANYIIAAYKADIQNSKSDNPEIARLGKNYTNIRKELREYVGLSYSAEGRKDIGAAIKIYNAFDEMESIFDQLAAKGIETDQIIGKIQKGLLKAEFDPTKDIPILGSILEGIFEKPIAADPSIVRLTKLVGWEISAYAKEISGAAVSDKERKDFEIRFADIGQSDKINRIIITEGKAFAYRSLMQVYNARLDPLTARFIFPYKYSKSELTLREIIRKHHENDVPWDTIKEAVRRAKHGRWAHYTNSDFERIVPDIAPYNVY